MSSLMSSTVKSGLIALGLFSSLASPSAAGPILQPDLSAPTNTGLPITPVRDDWAGGNHESANNWQWRRHNGRNFSRSGNWDGNWNQGGGRNWDRGDNWRWRHHRRHGSDFDSGAAAVLGLGLGLGLGSIYNNNNYNDGYYEQPAPRRYYRTQRLSSSHVQWCYDRYRSYRSSDNTFQPNYGPRKQCWSPYS